MSNIMERNQTVKGKNYPLSANSRLANLEFTKAVNWASKIYAPLKQHESSMCNRDIFQQMVRLLIKVYATDQTHALGAKKLFAGDITSLLKFRFTTASPWNVKYGVSIRMEPAPQTGKVKVISSKFCLSARQFIERAVHLTMRFYVYHLDEEKEVLQVQMTDDLLINFGVSYDQEEAHFNFPPINNGVLLLIGIAQLSLSKNDPADIFTSLDKRYYDASLIQTIAVKDGKLFNYTKKNRCPTTNKSA